MACLSVLCRVLSSVPPGWCSCEMDVELILIFLVYILFLDPSGSSYSSRLHLGHSVVDSLTLPVPVSSFPYSFSSFLDEKALEQGVREAGAIDS